MVATQEQMMVASKGLESAALLGEQSASFSEQWRAGRSESSTGAWTVVKLVDEWADPKVRSTADRLEHWMVDKLVCRSVD